MEDIYEEIVRIKNLGDVCALASIVRVKGSSPRPEGSKMLVRSDGTILGSIGEVVPKRVWEAATKVIRMKPCSFGFDMTGREDTPEGLICGGTMQVSIEPILPQPIVYILGAGHVGFAVSKIAKLAGFKVIVIDDRPAYANPERFPDADKILVEEPADMLSKINVNKVAHLVIACRGHLEDQRTLIEALKTNAFISVIRQ